jgi:UDP-N-acetylglucosamine--N-acetylmuramyl-(pentapeptide) pyrophosphoryl-undecaprenol N-acetylglucosamine transferase
MKLLITGGHLTPALGLIDYIQTAHPTDEIIFVGREYAQEHTKQPSKERLEVENRHVQFVAFRSGKFTELNPMALLKSLYLSITAFLHALQIISTKRPTIVVSFGSYLAVPVALAAWILQVPVITHEQTRTIGSANKFIQYFAKAVAVSYAESADLLQKGKAVTTGNVLRQQLLQKNPPQPAWITTIPTKPILYITGGSQGSEVINTVVTQCLPQLLKDWFVIHQCGSTSQKRSYSQELEVIREQLKPGQKQNYIIKEWISVEELAWIYHNADATISRAGANTTQEIALFAIPTIFIPLPFSRNDEQLLNAQWLTHTGGTLIVHQKDLTKEAILEALAHITQSQKTMKKKLQLVSIPMDADNKLYALAENFTNK